uniref:Uncharacterized protein n=1 Tax=Opuntia streptacantha TaxID=393608 RepID=A0A7C9EVW5_OPUST
MYSLYISSDVFTFESTGFPQGTTTSSLHFTIPASSGTFFPSPLVECFPLGGFSIYWAFLSSCTCPSATSLKSIKPTGFFLSVKQYCALLLTRSAKYTPFPNM